MGDAFLWFCLAVSLGHLVFELLDDQS